MQYTPIIGLEVHLELQTKSKMFCGCSTDIFQAEPNTHTCPVCLGLPGALPVANKQACISCLQIGLALGCTLNDVAVFARKHYGYPDLAKGYQISQYELPFCVSGQLQLADGTTIRITRAHMEEDTGKLVHGTLGGRDVSYVDFNRSGIPLVEIVSEPDIHSSAQAEEYGRLLQQLMQYLGVSEASMEKGLMRFEANISLKPASDTTDKLPSYKVEVKNLNSFKALRDAIEYEVKRQAELLNQNKIPAQETRGWDDAKNRTYAQREKENAHDYRYFPDPDLTPMTWMKSLEPQLLATLPELPWAKRARYQQDYGLSAYDAHVLTLDKNVATFFEDILAQVPEDFVKTIVKKIANWLTVEVGRLVNEHQLPLQDSKLQPNHILTIVQQIESSRLSNTNAKILLSELFLNGGDPESIIQSQNLAQVTDQSVVHAAIQKVLNEQAKAVAEYKSGKHTVLQFLIGMTMRELKGKGDTQTIQTILQNELS